MKTLLHFILLFIAIQTFGQNKITPQYTGDLDMMNYLSLNEPDKDILYEVILINKDIQATLEELRLTDKKINELDNIYKLSSNFTDIQTKVRKKQNKLADYRIFMISDIVEYTVIYHQLVYNIYENKLEDKSFLQQSNNVKKVRTYIEEANSQYILAEKYLKNIDDVDNDNDFIMVFQSVNKAYITAVENQRFALSLCCSVEIASVKPNSAYYYIEGTLNNTAVQEKKKEEQIANSRVILEEDLLVSGGSSNLAELTPNIIPTNNMLINKNIVFRIQIGAYINKINKDDLNGLSPLFIDDKDIDFRKILVGEHRSYRSAIASLRVIKKTTIYRDAFVVMYDKGVREPIKNMLEYNIDIKEKDAYVSYRNMHK